MLFILVDMKQVAQCTQPYTWTLPSKFENKITTYVICLLAFSICFFHLEILIVTS